VQRQQTTEAMRFTEIVRNCFFLNIIQITVDLKLTVVVETHQIRQQQTAL